MVRCCLAWYCSLHCAGGRGPSSKPRPHLYTPVVAPSCAVSNLHLRCHCTAPRRRRSTAGRSSTGSGRGAVQLAECMYSADHCCCSQTPRAACISRRRKPSRARLRGRERRRGLRVRWSVAGGLVSLRVEGLNGTPPPRVVRASSPAGWWRWRAEFGSHAFRYSSACRARSDAWHCHPATDEQDICRHPRTWHGASRGTAKALAAP